MANPQVVFEALLDLVQQIPDDEASIALEVMQRYSAGMNLEAYPARLVNISRQVPQQAREWFEIVLCVRVQQMGRDSAWRGFAQDAFREILATMLD
jgi:hypothetical protein